MAFCKPLYLNPKHMFYFLYKLHMYIVFTLVCGILILAGNTRSVYNFIRPSVGMGWCSIDLPIGCSATVIPSFGCQVRKYIRIISTFIIGCHLISQIHVISAYTSWPVSKGPEITRNVIVYNNYCNFEFCNVAKILVE